jgi:CRISPR-associated protein Cas5t
MRASKIRILAPITSFRYPHFLVGKQVSYAMPPPSTIYGHIASAMGGWPDPTSLSIAYIFKFESRATDLEHQHIISTNPPDKLSKEQSADFKKWRANHTLSVGGSVQPTFRDFLFNVEMTLYVTPASIGRAFETPIFPVVLGRSQDLACVLSVEEVDLITADGAYFENTLLPFSWRTKTHFGITALMSRFIGPPPEREAEFAQYITLRRGERIYGGNVDVVPNDRRYMVHDSEVEHWLIDPASTFDRGVHRGVVFHTFAD